MTLEDFPGAVKACVDWVCAGIAVATLTSILPPIAALISIIFGVIRIYETRTVQRHFRRRRLRRRA